MTVLFMVVALPVLQFWLKPEVKHGRCMAEPGTYSALLCPKGTWETIDGRTHKPLR